MGFLNNWIISNECLQPITFIAVNKYISCAIHHNCRPNKNMGVKVFPAGKLSRVFKSSIA